MASLTIENVPDELLDRLRKHAASHRRSLSAQALQTLQQAMAQPAADEQQATAAQVQAQVHQWRQLAGRWTSDQSAEEEIRDLYAARSRGREVEL